MIAEFVVDCSVGVAWAVASQATAQTDRWLDATASGARLIVPSIWPLEIANSLLVLSRRKRILDVERTRALDFLGRLRLVIDDGGARLALTRISTLAQEHELSIYDATYLELALRRKLPLASRDQSLCRAASRCGVKVLQ